MYIHIINKIKNLTLLSNYSTTIEFKYTLACVFTIQLRARLKNKKLLKKNEIILQYLANDFIAWVFATMKAATWYMSNVLCTCHSLPFFLLHQHKPRR